MATTPPNDRAQRVEALFQAAADLPAAERAAFLADRCGPDAALAGEVHTLLAHLSQAEGRFLESPAPGIDRLAEAPGAMPERVGRYRVIRLIGEGGMGVVYEAEQENPRRVVALELVRPGLATAQSLRRFQFEGEVLGQLQHPGIAQIFEAGTAPVESRAGTSAPLPFFAMEFVRGETLTRHAEQHRLATRQRLELFARVCDAVEHAHQRGVIHRDLKPGNILVDPAGQPKVLDFGVSRLVSADAGAASLATAAGQLIGTLPYMSPEQVAAEGGDAGGVDTRSDVYALGVILFELLTGVLPHPVAGCSITEAIRRIRDDEPLRAGVRVPSLRGEIEAICASALHKDRARRYQSASRLGDDIRRHLRDEPIEARRDSTFYVLRKGLRRHRVPAAAGALIFLLLCSFALYASVEARRFQGVAKSERESRREADEQRRAAEGQAARATASATLLRGMLTSADPNQVKGKDYTVRQLLDDFSQRMTPEMVGSPEVEATVREAMGTAYRGLAEFDRADEHLTAAYAAAVKAFGPAHAEVARVLEEHARLRHSQARLDEGLDVCLKSLDMRRRLLGPDHADIAASLDQWATLLIATGKYKEAKTPILESLAMRRRLRGDDDLLVASSLHGLALVEQHLGDFAAAEQPYRDALAIRRRDLKRGNPVLAATLFDFASLLKDRGRYAEAEGHYREALDAKTAAFGADHPEVAWCLTGLATVLRARAKFVEAEEANRRALTIWEKVHGPAHPGARLIRTNLAAVLRELGRLEEAESILRELLSAGPSGGNPRNVAQTTVNLAVVLRDRGRLDESREAFERALAVLESLDKREHPLKTNAAISFAETLLVLGCADDARSLLETSIEQSTRFVGPSHRSTLSATAGLARALVALGLHAEAASHAEHAHTLAAGTLEPNDPVLGDALSALAVALSMSDTPADAERAVGLAREALALRERSLPDGHWRIGQSAGILAMCLARAGLAEEAAPVRARALSILESAFGPDHPQTRRVSEGSDR